ncbi:MAG: C39 family peptidase [Pseudomonadota bacterium]
MRKYILFAIIFLSGFQPVDIFAENFTLKIQDMPDFCQGDTRYGRLPKFGATHCGPVAVSNALIWLNRNGFPNLAGNSYPVAKSQFDLILEISSSKHMKTDNKKGTQPKNIVAGLEKFIKDKGYGVKIKTMGWRSKAKRIGEKPDIKWMLNSVKSNSNLILNIGWYVFGQNENIYQRTGGHYVTVVGFDTDGTYPIFYVYDPAKRDGLNKETRRCSLKNLRSDTVLRLQSGSMISASGFYELHGLKIKKNNDLAIIDGAISFTVFLKN